jgi:hypothetical protein
MAHVLLVAWLDGVMHPGEKLAPYSFPGDNGATVIPGLFGTGSHTAEFVFYLQNTATEVGRASVTVQEGACHRLPRKPRRLQAIHASLSCKRPVGW